MININNKFNIGETVYLITEDETKPRIVYAIIITKCELTYKLASGTITSEHYEFELTEEKPILI